MKTPALPSNEELRLKSLYELGILETESEERFDRITRLAKRFFNVSICLVSLVDENRQWFKSCIGLDVKETSRDISFCGHSILENNVFIIDDTLLDDRFKDNPLVTGSPHIRFYAGYPIKLPNQTVLGTLCLIDTDPKHMTEEDIDTLVDLGKVVEDIFVSMHLSEVDDITGKYNRRGFCKLSDKGIDFCAQTHQSAHMVYIDMDNFKSVNDTLGHEVGNSILRQFSDIIDDTFNKADVIGRIGGDEFAILTFARSDQEVETLINSLSNRFKSAISQVEETSNLNFSYGVVPLNANENKSTLQLLDAADKKMYEHKSNKP